MNNEKKIYTFEEFVQYGLKAKDSHIVDGVPWSFDFHGVPITHEHDECYLIPGSNIVSNSFSKIVKFTPSSKIVVISDGFVSLFQKSKCIHHPHDRDQNDDGTTICNNCGSHFLFGQWR